MKCLMQETVELTAGVLVKLLSPSQVADLLNATLCAEDNELLTDSESELAQWLHDGLCQNCPAAIDIAVGVLPGGVSEAGNVDYVATIRREQCGDQRDRFIARDESGEQRTWGWIPLKSARSPRQIAEQLYHRCEIGNVKANEDGSVSVEILK